MCSKTHFYQVTVTNFFLKDNQNVWSTLKSQFKKIFCSEWDVLDSRIQEPETQGNLLRDYFPYKQDSSSSKDFGTLGFYFKATFEVYFKEHIPYGF